MSNRSLGRFIARLLRDISDEYSATKRTDKHYRQQHSKYKYTPIFVESVNDKWHSQEENHRKCEKQYWRISLVISIFVFIVAIIGAGFAYETYCATQDQAKSARTQAAVVTTPYVYAFPISHEDTSKEAYLSKPIPELNLGGFSISVFFNDFGQAPGIVYQAKCGLFFGYGLKHIDEAYFAETHPQITVGAHPNAARMNFQIRDSRGGIVVPSANSGKSEELKCPETVQNYGGFKISGASPPISIAEFIVRRGYYLKVRYAVQGKDGVFNECFRILLDNAERDGLRFQRQRDDCEDWDQEEGSPTTRR